MSDELRATDQDWAALFQRNPLAAEQIQVIILTRLLTEAKVAVAGIGSLQEKLDAAYETIDELEKRENGAPHG